MNLFDIVKRGDRAAVFDGGLVKAIEMRIGDATERCVSMAPGAEITIRCAHEIVCLASAPHIPGWQLAASDAGYAEVEISARSKPESGLYSVFSRTKVLTGEAPKRIQLGWPAWTGDRNGYSLTVSNRGEAHAFIGVGPVFSARPALLGELQGSGVEVGPGANPCVKPSQTVRVKYVEAMSAEEWARVYAKRSDGRQMDALWDSYVVASAHELEVFPDESLDFIFSNHVFEHLVNPLGVLGNWYRKLKPNGMVAAIIPDARFTFDLRQPLSTLEECVEELNDGDFSLRDRHYEKWCRYTAPYNTPADLIRRRYSVHAKYYTPDIFRRMAEYSARELEWDRIFVRSTLNGKDFGTMLRKSSK